jgi:undecaprenyl-diphosphatase
VPSTSSFPSGHVAVAVVLYGSLTLVARRLVPGHRVPRSTWLLPACVALVVGCSRVYEGVHHPTDVVAGALLGLGALIAAAYASGMLADRRPTVPDDD